MLSMWGKIMIPMNMLWLHGLYGPYGPRCPLSPKRLLNLITHSLACCWPVRTDIFNMIALVSSWFRVMICAKQHLNQWWHVLFMTCMQMFYKNFDSNFLGKIKTPHIKSLRPNHAYRQISNISHTKSQTLNVPCLVLQLSLPNPSKPGIKSRMNM